jgi:hypothetical protein
MTVIIGFLRHVPWWADPTLAPHRGEAQRCRPQCRRRSGRQGAPNVLAARPVRYLLTALATGDTNRIREAAAALADAAAALADAAGAVAAAAAATAVLPPGLYPADERLAAVTAALAGRDDDGRAAALLAERPWRSPG